jgi:muramidase (phage lysozyme)
MAPFSRSSFIPKSIALNPECKNDPVVLELKGINNNMRKIDAYVVLGIKGKRKQIDDQRKKDTDSKRREKKLSIEKQRKVNPINFIKERLPRTGFLDAIRNFILYTAMGMAVPFALKNLPKILGVVKFILPIYKVFEDFMGNVLGGIVSAVDFGYKVHDKIRGILKKVTGDKFEKSFDDLEKNLNTFLNLAVVLGLAVAGSGGIPMPKGPKGSKVPSGGPLATKLLPSGSLSRVNDSYARFIAGEANIGDRARLARRGYIDVQDTLTKGGPDALAKRAARKAGAKTGGKFIGKFGKIFGRVPIIGGLIDFAISMMMGEKPGRAAAKAIGSTIGFGLGAAIPVLGQIGVGEIIGGFIGDIIGGALYDTLSSFGKPQKHATGGRVGSKSYSRIPRTIKKATAKRPPKQLRQRTMPGKNVGGEDAIKKLFPDSDKEDTMSPLRLLKKNAGVMKKAGVFGNLLSSGVEMMALGQKIERPTLMGLEKYLAFVIDSSIDDQTATNAKMLGSSMFAMASGGIVPASRTISQTGTSPGQVVAKEIVRSFTAMLDNRSSEIFQNIRKELELKSPAGVVPGGPGEPGTGVEGMSGYGSPEEQALLKAIRFAEGTTKSYGVISGGDVVQELADGKLTVQEVIDLANTSKLPARFGGRSVNHKISGATGAYQFMPNTLRGLVKEGTLKSNDLFTPEMQDKAALALAARRGVKLKDLKKEGLSSSIAAKLAPVWASFPTLSGESYYGQPVKGLSTLQQVYKQSLTQTNTQNIGTDPIAAGLSLLKMGFTVAENKFFTKFKGLNPLGNSPISTEHGNPEKHAVYALDVTDFHGDERDGIERLKKLFIDLFVRRKELGIDQLIFDPIGYWFESEGKNSFTPKPYGHHPDHLHIRFKNPATFAKIKNLVQPTQNASNKNKPLNIASSPQLQKLKGSTEVAMTNYNDTPTKTLVLIQPVLT